MFGYARFNDPVTGEKLDLKNVTETAWTDEMRAKLDAWRAETAAMKDEPPK